ncbi:MAG: hypothetical protein ABFD50_15790 [Smithella sp.]
MPGVNFQRSYDLGEIYFDVQRRAALLLKQYIKNPGIYAFDDARRTITFSSERLIPIRNSNRPRLMLLFSNPHPLSIHQGMFLAPNTKGQESLFWSTMRESGWIVYPKEHLNPKQLEEICLNVQYEGPFELIFYCYYAFPTNYPEEISKIFGQDYFKHVIVPEADHEFMKVIQETNVKAVVTFNKGIFNLVSNDSVRNYVQRLANGELICSKIKDFYPDIPIYLTYPTGWRYQKGYRLLRRDNLAEIRTTIIKEL